jgi:hypothetical protein
MEVYRHIKIAGMMLRAGANVNASGVSVEGRIALGGSAENGRLDKVQMLRSCVSKVIELR